MDSAKHNILYLTYDGLTDALGQSQILPYIIGLTRKGYRYTVISFEKPAQFELSSATVYQLCRGEGIDWRPQVYHKRPAVISTVYDLFVLWRIANRIIRENSVTIVHCRSYLTALIGLRLKRQTGVKFVFDMRGFWADERVEGQLWSLDKFLYRWIYRYFKRAERRLVQESDYVVVLTQAAKDEIMGWRIADHIEIIPCCVDLTVFNPAHISTEVKQQLRAALGINQDDFVLLYLGSLGTWYMSEEMVEFYRRMRAIKSNCRFLLLTRDVDQVQDSELILRTAQRSEVPKYIAIADASICFIKPTFSKKGSSATKMAEVLSMNVPVITNRGWGDVEFLQSRINGLIVTDGTAAVPAEVFAGPIGTQTDFFREYFSLETGVLRYDKVYKSLIR